MKIGVDLGGTNIRAGLINNNSIINMKSALLSNKDNLESTLDQLRSLIHKVYVSSVTGIGIGVPSVVDMENGIVYDVVNIPSWKEVHLGKILEEEFKVPVFINNDVNCFVLGEKYFGHGKNHKSFVGIALGTGIGSGIIIDDKLISGVNCGAGEIGYLPYLEHDLEYYCSSNFFDKEHNTSGYQAYLDAKQNCPKAIELWAEFGRHLGTALKSVVYAYDPEAIILGGSISKSFSFFKEQMELSLKDTYFPKSMEKLKIYVSEVENVSMLGAAAQVDHHQEYLLESTLANIKKK
ncbi:MAG: ROK family protein [Cyclobacteriaceae bacterium]|nr:ROK family protein [Cyclobacteriaceae bacterium]